jgi:hypothetical protein
MVYSCWVENEIFFKTKLTNLVAQATTQIDGRLDFSLIFNKVRNFIGLT